MMRSLAPLGVAALVMLPRLASPQFGFLDDGLTLQTGREVAGRWSSVLHLIPETGRFFPAYWLAYSLLVAAVGVQPLAFFAANVLLLAVLLALLAHLVRSTGGTPGQAAVAMVVFAVSGPAIETFYTLSKAEALQLLWIGLSLLAAAAAARAESPVRRAGLLTLATAACVLAYATKETSVVLVPIALGWLLLERGATERSDTWRRFAASSMVISLLAAAAFFLLRSQYAALALGEGAYTRAYALASAGPALFRIVAWLARDFAFLLPLVVAALVLRGGAPSRRRAVRYAAIWMAGWLAVYLPWPATFGYHLLPFAFGAALLAGTLAGDVWGARDPASPGPRRRLAGALLGASALLWLVAVLNAAADARIQLAVDRVNADLVDFLGGLPAESRVVLNMAPVNEYHFELPMHLVEIKQRPDIVVEPPGPAPPPGPEAAEVFVVTAEMAHQPGPTVRIAPREAGVQRDHATLRALVGDRPELVYRTVRHTPVVEIGLQRLLCPLAVRPVLDATYCPRDRGLVDGRTFSYGWQVHRLARPAREGPR